MKRCFGIFSLVAGLLITGLVGQAAAEGLSVLDELRAENADPVQLAMRGDSQPRSRSSDIKAVIDLEEQEMKVYVDGSHEYTWKVSTGRRGYITPNGTYKPQWLSRMHYSRKYDDAPMPYSVFFHGGYAVHGTTSISRLGRPASHGCVRLHPDNAKKFFNLVQQHGKANAVIKIVGQPPTGQVARSSSEASSSTSRSIYVDSARSKKSRSSNSVGCLGCSSMAKFGSVPSIH
jgi:hypothetical protein